MDTMNSKNLKPVKLFFVSYSPSNMDPELPPIIFVHGLGGTNRSWSKVRTIISERTKRQIYLVDLRNHGNSEFSDDVALDYLVADVENLMQSENIFKAVLVGHSLGGRVTTALALKRPELVEKLVCEDTPLTNTDKDFQTFKKFVTYSKAVQQAVKFLPRSMTEVEAQKKLQEYLSAFQPELLENTSASNIFFTLPMHKTKTGEFKWDVNMDALMKMADDFKTLEVDLSDTHVYHGDFLLLIGEKSALFKKEDIEVYRKYFSNIQTQFFKDGVHVLHVEFPEKYTEVVSKFIGE